MKVLLTVTKAGIGKVGSVIDVDDQRGNMLIGRGIAQAVSVDAPKKNARRSVMTKPARETKPAKSTRKRRPKPKPKPKPKPTPKPAEETTYDPEPTSNPGSR